MDLPETFAAASCLVLRERRQKLGISQEEVARRSGLARSYICDVERGARHPSLRNVSILSEALELRTSELFFEVELKIILQVDPSLFRSSQGNESGASLVKEIMEYFDNYYKDGVILADSSGFLFFNKAANQMTGIGAQDLPPEEWPRAYGCFRPDKVSSWPYSDLPLVRALAGESSDNQQMYLRNQALPPEGKMISVSGRPVGVNGSNRPKAGVVFIKDLS